MKTPLAATAYSMDTASSSTGRSDRRPYVFLQCLTATEASRRQILQAGFVAAVVSLILCSCTAVLAQPPKEEGKREAHLVELTKLDKTIKLDIRYATKNNFVGKVVYPEARAFMQRPAAEAIVRVHQALKKEGLGLVIFDGYRPWSITKLFWETVPEEQKIFVADPAIGSKHNRGCAVDLSMFDRKTGKLVPMPSGYDEFTERASPDYRGGTEEERANRDKLRRLMEAEGFTVNPNEWWHFDYNGWENYAIYDISFSEIGNVDLLKGFTIRRVEFSGNIQVRDRDIRTIIGNPEGDVFSKGLLAKWVRAVNSLGFFEKISDKDIAVIIDRRRLDVDFVFYLKEKAKK